MTQTQTNSAVAVQVRGLPPTVFSELVPTLDRLLIGDVRESFVRFVVASDTAFPDLAEAWAEFIGPESVLRFTPRWCTKCRGRGSIHNGQDRTTTQTCPMCTGRRWGTMTKVPALKFGAEIDEKEAQ